MLIADYPSVELRSTFHCVSSFAPRFTVEPCSSLHIGVEPCSTNQWWFVSSPAPRRCRAQLQRHFFGCRAMLLPQQWIYQRDLNTLSRHFDLFSHPPTRVLNWDYDGGNLKTSAQLAAASGSITQPSLLLRLSMVWALFVCCFPVFFYFPMFLYTCLYLCFTHDVTKGSSTHALRVGLCLLLVRVSCTTRCRCTHEEGRPR